MKRKKNLLGLGLLIPALIFVSSCDGFKIDLGGNGTGENTNQNKVTLDIKFIDETTNQENSNIGTVSYAPNNLVLNKDMPIAIVYNDNQIITTKIVFNGVEELENFTSLKISSKTNTLEVYFRKTSIKDDFNCTEIPDLLAKRSELQENEETNESYWAYGKVTEVHEANNPRIFIEDNDNNRIQAYNVKNFSSYPTLEVGDEVVVKGRLKVYLSQVELFDVTIEAHHSGTSTDNGGGNGDNQDIGGDSNNPYDPKYPGYVADANDFTNVEGYQVTKIYDPKYIGSPKDYSGANTNSFYSNYKPATTYNDAIARSEANLMSGDIKTPDHLANYNNVKNPMTSQNVPYMNARIRYICKDSSKTEIIGYLINDLDGNDANDTVIFKGGAYISQDEMAAYLFAFHTVPANYTPETSGKVVDRLIDKWGKYARLNNGYFEGTRPYQPEMTNTYKFKYHETDFGHDGNFIFFDKNGNPNRNQKIYNDGHNITRGTCRFTYSGELENYGTYEDDEERHVFYTWTHYNSFEEYLNYKGGYGIVFGSLCVGNEYNTKNPEYPVRQATKTQLALFK